MSFGGVINSHNMTSGGAILQFPFSLSIKNKMEESRAEIGLPGDTDPNFGGQNREEGDESRSGSDNLENPSGDDQDNHEEGPPRKKKYHRHTPQQIQELESFFKECPHPDDKQRTELSNKLGLESKQIKFWFQNRRTQMKTQMERHENVVLRQEHEKLRAENEMLKEALKHPLCCHCGGQAMAVGGMSGYEVQQLRAENARLKDEMNRFCMLTNKFLGRPLTSTAAPIDLQSNSGLDLAVGRNEFGGPSSIAGSTLPIGLEFVEGPAMPLMRQPVSGMMGNEISSDRNMFVDLALAAMEEFMKLAQSDCPLWVTNLDGTKEVLNESEYFRTCVPCIGVKPHNFVTEASRETGLVMINTLALVENLMVAHRWVEMFPSMVSGAITLDTIAPGINGTRSGTLQLMVAEFQVLSPLVPLRQVRFLRFCKQHAEGLWAVVDISVDVNREGANAETYVTCRRLPSGCVIQEMPNNCSKVTWLEHSEYDESVIHSLCRPLVRYGLAFGAQRWVATLQRQCESLTVVLSTELPEVDGRRSLLRLADRMMFNFCSGVCASSARHWDKLRVGHISEEVRILTRKNLNDPGEPPGTVLCAATSVWMPLTRQRLFDFMRNEGLRNRWDILSSAGSIEVVSSIAKGQDPGNCVSLLRVMTVNPVDSTMMILQETWNDASGSLVVYAPVDAPAANLIMDGADSSCVALLPSGFAILPDGQTGHGAPMFNSGEGCSNNSGTGGCILTVGFQILVSTLPTSKLTVESVETVNNLLNRTVEKIRAAVL